MEGNVFKATGTAIVSFFAGLTGSTGVIITLAVVMMLVDYFTGCMAAYYESKTGKGDGLHSKTGLTGIFKKAAYMGLIGMSLLLDLGLVTYAPLLGITLPFTHIFSLIVPTWFFLNETISILENSVRMGVEVPNWLLAALKVAKNKVDTKAKDTLNEIGLSEDSETTE